MKKIISIFTAILFISNLYSQNLDTYKDIILIDDKYEIISSNINEIKAFDMSGFWLDSMLQKVRYGFIGSNYRRLDIRFIEITKDNNNLNKYIVRGKSRVSGNICDFKGDIELKESYYLKSNEFFVENAGIIAGNYILYEDKAYKHSGVFYGRFISYWRKDKNGNFVCMELPENEGNNQFVGFWQSYGKTKLLHANWGNWRLYLSGDLDVGTSEFAINQKYQLNGWDTFFKAYGGGYNDEIMNVAKKEEIKEWWEE